MHILLFKQKIKRNFSLLFACIFLLSACQPALWGTPPPPPTPILPTVTFTLPPPTLTSTFTPLPSTFTPAAVVIDQTLLWASPAVPSQ
ncbi:MAG TPA: hypothetical protein PKV19_02480, partial [Anaerolineales bacterium]|nr:hypothetical protein [Anaerolineales bacterium]